MQNTICTRNSCPLTACSKVTYSSVKFARLPSAIYAIDDVTSHTYHAFTKTCQVWPDPTYVSSATGTTATQRYVGAGTPDYSDTFYPFPLPPSRPIPLNPPLQVIPCLTWPCINEVQWSHFVGTSNERIIISWEVAPPLPCCCSTHIRTCIYTVYLISTIDMGIYVADY